MKRFIFLFILSTAVHAEELTTTFLWGGYGFGLASTGAGYRYGSAHYELGLRVKQFSLAINHTSNASLGIFVYPEKPTEQFTSTSILLGYTHTLWRSSNHSSELNMNSFVGYGTVAMVMKGEKTHDLWLLPDKYDKVEARGNGFPLEVQLEYRTSQYWGFNVGYHVNANKYRTNSAIQIGIIAGLF